MVHLLNICPMITTNLTIKLIRKVKKDLKLKHANLNNHWYSITSYIRLQELTDLYDFTFIVKDQEFKVHKVCLADASDVMRAMFVAEFNESRTNSTAITDIDPKAFQIFIHYIYGNKNSFETNFTDNLVFEVFKVAHKYNVENLLHFCMSRIFENFTGIDQILETYSFASLYDIEDILKNYCWEVIQ
jgi:BTB/POZ domain